MRKYAEPGTRVATVRFDDEGVILHNRRTMPNMRMDFDYQVRLDFVVDRDDKQVEWGYAAGELREVGP